MKKILSIIGLVSLTLISVQAADVVRFGGATGNPYAIVGSGSGGWTNSIAAGVTATNATSTFIPQDSGEVAFQFKGIGANDVTTNNATVALQQSVNGNDWVALSSWKITSSSGITNIVTGGVPYVRVYSIANADAGALTNYTITICPKR